MPPNNVHRRALRSVSPRKEARKSTDKGADPLPPAEPPLKQDEPPREAAEPGPKAGGKMPPQNVHRRAMRSVSPMKGSQEVDGQGVQPATAGGDGGTANRGGGT